MKYLLCVALVAGAGRRCTYTVYLLRGDETAIAAAAPDAFFAGAADIAVGVGGEGVRSPDAHARASSSLSRSCLQH